MHGHEMSKDELNTVVGGASDIPEGAPQPKYNIGDRVYVKNYMFDYKSLGHVKERDYWDDRNTWVYTVDTGDGIHYNQWECDLERAG